MCLHLRKKDLNVHVAAKDIICYKRISFGKTYDITKIKHGDPFEGIIGGTKVSGRISIEDDCVYYCNNYEDGNDCKEKFGFTNSWRHDESVEDIIVNGGSIMIGGLVTPYRNFKIEIGNTYTSKLIKSLEINENDDRYHSSVGKGIHSFALISGAHADKDTESDIIVKCIIPEGSQYYVGHFSNQEALASDTLTYLEIVDEKNMDF